MNMILVALGLAAGGLYMLSSNKTRTVTTASGKQYIIKEVGKAGSTESYVVYVPANPPVHGEYPILQYSKTMKGPNEWQNQITGTYPGVTSAMLKAAQQDLGIGGSI